MHSPFETAPAASAIPISFVTKSTWEAISRELPAEGRQFALANGFAAKPGKCLVLPAADGRIAQVLFGLEDATAASRDLFRPGALPGLLPPGLYRFANAPHDLRLATLAFALGSYRFGRYRKTDAPDVRLVPSDGIEAADIMNHDDSELGMSKKVHDGTFVRSIYFMDPDGILLEFAAWTRQLTEGDVRHRPATAAPTAPASP